MDRSISSTREGGLIRVLTSPLNERADVGRQFHERVDEGMVEILAELEADELIRLRVIESLRYVEIDG